MKCFLKCVLFLTKAFCKGKNLFLGLMIQNPNPVTDNQCFNNHHLLGGSSQLGYVVNKHGDRKSLK